MRALALMWLLSAAVAFSEAQAVSYIQDAAFAKLFHTLDQLPPCPATAERCPY